MWCSTWAHNHLLTNLTHTWHHPWERSESTCSSVSTSVCRLWGKGCNVGTHTPASLTDKCVVRLLTSACEPRGSVVGMLVCLFYSLFHCTGSLEVTCWWRKSHMWKEPRDPNDHIGGYLPTMNIYNGFSLKSPLATEIWRFACSSGRSALP